MKKSANVPLIMIGTITMLGGCNDYSNSPIQVTQGTYASQADCQRDWGNDPRDCRTSSYGGGGTGGGGTGGSGRYVGPRYYWDHSSGKPYAIDPDGSTRPISNSYLSRGQASTATSHSHSTVSHSSVSRGGFGSFGRGFSGGG